jgi:hypothetical protein
VSTGFAPLQNRDENIVAPVSTAGNDLNTAISRAPFTGAVVSVTYIPSAAITGAATNHRTVSLVNKGQDGSGSTTIATLAFDNGINAAANDEKTITLSGTAANRDVTEGDVLQWQSTHIGSGIADPGGTVIIVYDRDQ